MNISTQGYSTTCRFDLDTAYKMLADAGFTAIDWAIDCLITDGRAKQVWNRQDIDAGKITPSVYDRSLDEIIKAYTPEIEAIKRNGLKIAQAHAPFPAYTVSDPNFLDYAIEVYKKAIKLCEYADCPYVVIHGISRRVHEYSLDDEKIHELNMKLYSSLIPTLKESNVTVLLENLFSTLNGTIYFGTCSDPADAINYIDTLNDLAGKECFGLCFDVGHANLLRYPIPEYVQKLGKRIKALHIHDNNMLSDDHLAPYTGNIRWHDLYNSLKKIGYDGDLNFETFKQTSVARCPDEMVLPSLRFIKECGEFFKSKITDGE